MRCVSRFLFGWYSCVVVGCRGWLHALAERSKGSRTEENSDRAKAAATVNMSVYAAVKTE